MFPHLYGFCSQKVSAATPSTTTPAHPFRMIYMCSSSSPSSWQRVNIIDSFGSLSLSPAGRSSHLMTLLDGNQYPHKFKIYQRFDYFLVQLVLYFIKTHIDFRENNKKKQNHFYLQLLLSKKKLNVEINFQLFFLTKSFKFFQIS